MSWLRLLRTVSRPAAGGLLLAVLAGVGAAGAGVGLMATAAWLISRAALHPPVLHLMAAIVAVRAFGIRPRRAPLCRAPGRPRRCPAGAR
jgi:ABC-type transport system involved in cytochrome bd biosynthesis fused ATPase/permease subunit